MQYNILRFSGKKVGTVKKVIFVNYNTVYCTVYTGTRTQKVYINTNKLD